MANACGGLDFMSLAATSWALGSAAFGGTWVGLDLQNATEMFMVRVVNSNEFKRWLLKQGVTFESGKGSHVKLHFNGRQSVLPMHAKELKTGTVEGIKKQLGLKGK